MIVILFKYFALCPSTLENRIFLQGIELIYSISCNLAVIALTKKT